LEILIDGLLDPVGGCPWDRRQTTKTVTEDFLEEVYELREALNEDHGPSVREEAGDVAFLLVFLGRLAERRFSFGLKEIFDSATDKMLTRHPHVFGEEVVGDDLDSFFRLWHKIKRSAKPTAGVLSSVPKELPALTRCHRLGQKAGRSGFDFSSVDEVRRTLDSELQELDAELAEVAKLAKTDGSASEVKERLSHEIGDVLASVVNLARLSGISAEKALDAYNRRFIARFEFIEAALAEKGLKPEQAPSEELERLWGEAKKSLGMAPVPPIGETGPQ
jgi:MazG family protein